MDKDYGRSFIYEMDLNEQKEFLENNSDYYEPISNFNQMSINYNERQKDTAFGRNLMSYAGLAFFVVFYLLDRVLNKNLRLQYRGVCYYCGESKNTIINIRLFNFILIILIATLCSWAIVSLFFGIRFHLMTYAGLGFSVLILSTVIFAIIISDYIKLKKLNFSEILNFREN